MTSIVSAENLAVHPVNSFSQSNPLFCTLSVWLGDFAQVGLCVDFFSFVLLGLGSASWVSSIMASFGIGKLWPIIFQILPLQYLRLPLFQVYYILTCWTLNYISLTLFFSYHIPVLWLLHVTFFFHSTLPSFTTVKMYPSMDEWINKMWYTPNVILLCH